MGIYSQYLLTLPGVVSYWALDETSGTTATDGKDGNNGTYTGTAGVNYTLNVAGPTYVGAGATFDGTTGFVDTTNNINL